MLYLIRFCNKKMYCITKEELDEEQLKVYFMDGHENEQMYVLDNGEFFGCITYDSFTRRKDGDFVIKDHLVMDENIWSNGRLLFKKYAIQDKKLIYVPVVDKLNQLICFAWQDREANRELRMLDELVECGGMLSFKEVYSDYDCVTIYGCNELAYYFAKYLKGCGIIVNVIGDWWENFFIQKWEAVPDDRNYLVYSEGVKRKKNDAEKYESVSAEFECIDHIYEENIYIGMIKDAEGDLVTFLEKLRKNPIAILGVGEEAQNAYDIFLSYGVDIDCFVSEEKGTKKLFGEKIVSLVEAEKISDKIIFVDPKLKYSAWGFGETDYYHYMGYKRNERFFMLQDYTEIHSNGLLNVLDYTIRQNGGNLVLLGDIWLCVKASQIFREKNKRLYEKVVYADVLNDQIEEKELNRIDVEDITDTDLCLLLIPEFYGNMDDPQKVKCIGRRKERYLNKLRKLNITNVFDYSLNNIFVMDWETREKNLEFEIGGVLIGAINGFSGNMFFRGLLDNHPKLLMLDLGSLNNNLFMLCIRLSIKKSDEILLSFWRLCEEQKGMPDDNFESNFPQKELFNHYMREMLVKKEQFTSQELFVIIHIAYAKMWGKEVGDLSDMLIYWEPHHVPRNKCEDYAIWLCTIGKYKYIINIVRNAYVRAGSYLKLINRLNVRFCSTGVFEQILGYPNEEKKDYAGWERIVLRFEDIKCSPKEVLKVFSDKVNVAWADTLLETTLHGEVSSLWGVTGFDLKPVYCIYEEYFSSFDRFRISLITAPWQKRYGYPYVNNMDFSRRELQEIFSKDFRFENEKGYRSSNEKERIKKEVKRIVDDYLQMNRREEIMERNNMNECKEKENFVV